MAVALDVNSGAMMQRTESGLLVPSREIVLPPHRRNPHRRRIELPWAAWALIPLLAAAVLDVNSGAIVVNGTTTTKTWPHTPNGTPNYVQVRGAWAILTVNSKTPTVDYGGVTMRSVALDLNNSFASSVNGKAQIWEANTADGTPVGGWSAAQTVTVNFNGTASGNFGVFGSETYTGVDQTTSSNGAVTLGSTTAGTSSTLTVTTGAAGDIAVDCISVDTGASALAVTGSNTAEWNSNGNTYLGASSSIPGGASVVLSWGWTASRGHAQAAINIKAAASGINMAVAERHYRSQRA